MPPPDIDAFVARVRAERLADGLSEYITDPGVYRLLDGIMAGRPDIEPETRDERRRAAVARSRVRIPYE